MSFSEVVDQWAVDVAAYTVLLECYSGLRDWSLKG